MELEGPISAFAVARIARWDCKIITVLLYFACNNPKKKTHYVTEIKDDVGTRVDEKEPENILAGQIKFYNIY